MNYWNDVENHEGAERLSQFWLADPEVRRSVNASVTGSPDEWPLEWFAREFRQMLPLGRCAVIGSGTGALERDLLAKKIVLHATAVDVASGAVAFARDEAARAGLDNRASYVVEDAAEFLESNENCFDAIFFHGSLHHLNPVANILMLARRSLRPGGLLYLDEYIGPSMKEWTWWRLTLANIAYYAAVPRALRRPRLVRAPRNPSDPTEMIDASSILPAVRRMFRVVSERGYGGNILGLVYGNLATASPAAARRRVVQRLIRIDRMVARLAGDHHAVVIALNEPPE
jgi:SAM-dependent methyltransferase